MTRTTNSKGSRSDLQKFPISMLADLLIDEVRVDNIDEAIRIEESICKQINDSNIDGIEKLLVSKERYCNIAAIRILSDSGRVGIEKIFHHIDQLFERDDRALIGLGLRLVQQHDYNAPPAMKRMAQFVDYPDDIIIEIVRVWLLWRSPDELVEFSNNYGPFDKNVTDLLDLIREYKSKMISIDQFFDRLLHIDSIAFQEFTRLKENMPRFSDAVFHSRN